MKKLLAVILSITMIISLCPVAFAEGEANEGGYVTPDDGYDADYEPFDDYEYFDEEGNYEPMETFFSGKLAPADESVNIS